jgi:hypothetical protein
MKGVEPESEDVTKQNEWKEGSAAALLHSI